MGEHNVASNTRDCFSTWIGCKVVGVLFDAMPPRRKDLSGGTKTLIFEDGYGLTISSHGTFWVEKPDDIQWALREKRRELEATGAELESVLEAAGATRA